MEYLKDLKLPYEALTYTIRALTAEGVRGREKLESELQHAMSSPVLPVKPNAYTLYADREVESYRKLLELVAQIAAINPRNQLFFRGQNNNWINGSLDKVLYAGLWRDKINASILQKRCLTLNDACTRPLEGFSFVYGDANVYLSHLRCSPLVRWALLQHYGVCETPLLDVTRSLQVACTFARMGAEYGFGYVYVLAMPYQREAISIDDAEGITIMSLLGVTP